MLTQYPLAAAVVICVLSAILEGFTSGTGVKKFFDSLKLPQHSPPLWLWTIIGGAYYLIFCFILYRLLSTRLETATECMALALICVMLVGNGFANYVIFRRRDLRNAWIIGAIFPALDFSLFILMLFIDTLAVYATLPYLAYRGYAVWWGYALYRNNS